LLDLKAGLEAEGFKSDSSSLMETFRSIVESDWSFTPVTAPSPAVDPVKEKAATTFSGIADYYKMSKRLGLID
jgi:hypothetical protein